MVSSVFPLLMAAALGQQAPAEAAWLKALPADVDAVVRVKGLSSTRDELVKMVEAMSPTLAQQATPVLSQGLDHVAERLGEAATTTPFLVALKLPKPDAGGGPPPMAILVKSDNYEGVLKGVAGPNAEFKLEKQDGLDSFKDQDGDTVYALKGQGFVAFAPESPDVLKLMASKPSSSLDAKLSGDVKAALFGGDAGLYVSLAAVTAQYGEQIDQFLEQMQAAMDQAGGQVQPGQAEQAKEAFKLLVDALKQGDAVALNLDFDAAGLDLSGLVSVKSDSQAAQTLKQAKPGSADKLGNLPGDALLYVYSSADPSTIQNLSRMNLAGPAADSAEYKKAMEAMKKAGRQETYGAVSFGDGFQFSSVAYPENPQQALVASKEMGKAMGGGDVVKGTKTEENALTHKGFKLSKTTVTFDLEKMAAAQPNNPAAEKMMQAMFGGDSITVWSGTDGKAVVSVIAKDAEEAKKRIDSALGGPGSIGSSAGFKAVRDKLPKQVSTVVLFNAQEMVRQFAKLFSSIAGAEIQPPADLPKELAFFGGSVAASPAGYRFDFYVPSRVGPVFEKGFGSIIQGMQGQVNQ